jgi:MoxR-like ATPase
MYRHSTCPFCETTDLKSIDGKLFDHITKAPHICAGQPMPSAIPAEGNVPAIVAAQTMTDDVKSAWEGLVPAYTRYQSYIPRMIDGDTDLAHMRIALANHQNVLLYGPKGSGKNHLTEAVAAIERLPIIAVNFNLGTREEDIVGQMHLVDGTTVFEDGALSFCMRYGGIFVGDEINAIPREVAFAMHQATDDRRQLVLTVKGREIVRAHPRFMFIGAMNPDYAGTRDLNEAFEDRFHLSIEIDYNEQVEIKLIKDTRLLKLAKDIRDSYKSVNDDRVTKTVSTRALMMHEENVRLHGVEIARMAFLNRWKAEDRAVVEKVYDAHMRKPKY